MKRLFALVALSLACLASQAAPNTDPVLLDISRLTAEQKATLLKSAEQMEGVGVSATIRTEAGKWGELGTNMGKAAVSAAKEVGLAANEFVATPLGKITMGVVVYKIIGRDILGIIFGSGIIIVFLSMSLFFVFKTQYTSVEYERIPVLWGLYNRRTIKSFSISDEGYGAALIAALICAILGLLIGLNIIF